MRHGTYSIVARDRHTGDLGVAVQSHWFSVGSVVPWARAGVGAVATQSVAEPAYGPRALDLMEDGLSAARALQRLVERDAAADVRQVAAVDVDGVATVHSGDGCIPFAGHESGDGVSCQANMMASPAVWGAMAGAYRDSGEELPLAERLLVALDAAEAAGGDVRGRQSAALLVVAGEPQPAWGRSIDLRVEDHADPLRELRRLLVLHRAYELASAGDDLVAGGRHEEAGRCYSAAADLAPHSDELLFWAGLAAFDAGDPAVGLDRLQAAVDANPRWRALLEQLPPHVAPSAGAARAALDRD